LGGAVRANCPHCQEELILDIISWEVREPKTKDPESWLNNLSEHERILVDRCVESGLVKAFTEALEGRTTGQQTPRNPRRLLLTFFKTSAPKRVPQWALDYYIGQFGGRIEFWGSEGVLAIISDGSIRAFAPVELLLGVAARNILGGKKRVETTEREFYSWASTRHGYVAVRNGEMPLLFRELKKKSRGAFQRPVL
jgi:hypothetical protein